jgi:hypothetical protein
MEEFTKHGEVSHAAMKAGMDRKTARKYIEAGKLPSEMVKARDWRTRADPFEEHWPEIEERLRATPELEAKTLFELLREQHPDRYVDGQLRTLQRRIRQWRAMHGPEQDVVFAQRHRPGEAAQTDFTNAAELAVTIAGQLFVHMLCVLVLPYSNWQWATVCLSESNVALKRGVQRALFQLGRVPKYHQTDNSTAATHNIPDGAAEPVDGRVRPFNRDYLTLMRRDFLCQPLRQAAARNFLAPPWSAGSYAVREVQVRQRTRTQARARMRTACGWSQPRALARA